MAGGLVEPVERDPGHDAGASLPSRTLLLVPLILVLMPGLVEFTCMLNAVLSLNETADRAATAAGAGAGPEEIGAIVRRCRHGVDGRFVQCEALRIRRDAGGHGSLPGPQPGAMSAANGAGERIRVTLEYDYELVLGCLLAPFFGAGDDARVELQAVADAVRQ